MEDGKGILHQPIGELLQREISADFLKKEIKLPDFLKKEIPGGILDKEITFGRRKRVAAADDEVEQMTCTMCGRQTPATVASCLHCGAHHEVSVDDSRATGRASRSPDDDFSSSLIDLSDELL